METISQDTVLENGFVRTPGCTLRMLNSTLDDRWPLDEDSALYWYLFKPVATVATAAAHLDQGVWATSAVGATIGSGGSSHVRLSTPGVRREHAQIHFCNTSYYLRNIYPNNGLASAHRKFGSKIHSTDENSLKFNHQSGTYINVCANGIRPDYVLKKDDVFYVDGHQFQIMAISPLVPDPDGNGQQQQSQQREKQPEKQQPQEEEEKQQKQQAEEEGEKEETLQNEVKDTSEFGKFDDVEDVNESDESKHDLQQQQNIHLPTKAKTKNRVSFGPFVTARVLPPRVGKRESPRRRQHPSSSKSNREEKVDDVQLIGSTAGSEQQSYVADEPDTTINHMLSGEAARSNKISNAIESDGCSPAECPAAILSLDTEDPDEVVGPSPSEKELKSATFVTVHGGAMNQEPVVEYDINVRGAQHLPDDEHFAVLEVHLTDMTTGEDFFIKLGSRMDKETSSDVQLPPFTFGSSPACNMVLKAHNRSKADKVHTSGLQSAEVVACLDAWDGQLRLVDIGSSFNGYSAARHDAETGCAVDKNRGKHVGQNVVDNGNGTIFDPSLVPWQVGTNVRVMRDCSIGIGDVIYVSSVAFQVGDVMLEGPTAELALRIRKAQGKGLDPMAAQAITRIATMGLQSKDGGSLILAAPPSEQIISGQAGSSSSSTANVDASGRKRHTESHKRLAADGGKLSIDEVFVRLPCKHATHIGKVESLNEKSKSVVVCKDFKMSSQNALLHPNGENYELYNLRSGPNHHVLFLQGRHNLRCAPVRLRKGLTFQVGRTRFKVLDIQVEENLDILCTNEAMTDKIMRRRIRRISFANIHSSANVPNSNPIVGEEELRNLQTASEPVMCMPQTAVNNPNNGSRKTTNATKSLSSAPIVTVSKALLDSARSRAEEKTAEMERSTYLIESAKSRKSDKSISIAPPPDNGPKTGLDDDGEEDTIVLPVPTGAESPEDAKTASHQPWNAERAALHRITITKSVFQVKGDVLNEKALRQSDHYITLQAMRGPGRNRVARFTTDRITIGNREDNSITIKDRSLSAHHCTIIYSNGHYFLVDRGSLSGTFTMAGSVDEPTTVAPGFTFRISNTEFEVYSRFRERRCAAASELCSVL